MKFENKIIIVTGSGRGIGKYIAKSLGKKGGSIAPWGALRFIEKESHSQAWAGIASKKQIELLFKYYPHTIHTFFLDVYRNLY